MKADTFTQTEWGCSTTPDTLTVERWYIDSSTSSEVAPPRSLTVTITAQPSSNGTAASPRPSLPAPAPSSSKSTNAGAIAGGVVGGLAALSVAAFGAYFLWRKNKRNKEAETAAQADGERSALSSAAGVPGPSPYMSEAQSKLTPELMGNPIQPHEETQKHVGTVQEPVEAPAYTSPVEAPSTPIGGQTSPVEAPATPVEASTSPVEAPTEPSPTR